MQELEYHTFYPDYAEDDSGPVCVCDETLVYPVFCEFHQDWTDNLAIAAEEAALVAMRKPMAHAATVAYAEVA